MTTGISRREAEDLEDHHHTNAINHELYGGGGDESDDAEEETALSSAADGGGNTIGFHATTSVQTQISQLHALGITYTTITRTRYTVQ